MGLQAPGRRMRTRNMRLKCSRPLSSLDMRATERLIFPSCVSLKHSPKLMWPRLNKAGLNIMGTAKKYQHQGAATIQVKEGTRIADELNALVSCLPYSGLTPTLNGANGPIRR